MSCPDCGSGQAVPKWVAWDASCEIPPKTKEKIERLQAELARVRRAILSVENCTATAAFVTTQIDLIDAALRGPEKP
jgi:hypothetical protein